MPRIDPLQLLKCLGVLLTPSGGIRSKEEVQRLASLMMKFSKKLVSKCVYILILKNTDTDLLGMFMSAGGWTLVLTWLSDGICGKNWALVIELLELLLMCPVDVERLKSNSIPRLVKGLSKDETLGQVNVLATKLVEQWLKIVKDETVPTEREISSTVVIVKQEDIVVEEIPENSTQETIEEYTVKVDPIDVSEPTAISPQSFYKLTVRDGKQVIAKVDSVSASVVGKTESDGMIEEENVPVAQIEPIVEEVKKDSEKKSNKDRSRHEKSKHRSSSSSKSSSSSSSSSSSNKDKSSSSSSSNSRDKHKDKDRHRDKDRSKDKYKHRSNGSTKHSSSSNNSSNKDSKEKQAEKDKDTLSKIQPKSVEKLGRIPKKSSSDDKSKSDKKDSSSEHRTKPSISIEVRKKDAGDRPKTVKVFNSKMRSTGLEEIAKPPPPRTTKKPTNTPPVLPAKRPSPSREPLPPPEKRIKLPETTDSIEKPGGIKLIPPKSKRAFAGSAGGRGGGGSLGGLANTLFGLVASFTIISIVYSAFLQESDMFMDALAASATNKKEPKKRKRRLSVTKENTTSTSSPPSSPAVNNTTSPLNSPLALKSITAPKFYKDTLETDEAKPMETEDVKPETDENEIRSPDESEDGPTENVVKEVDGLRGVLVYHKRKGPKKTVKWRTDNELEEIQYFELDETERVNVTKTFMDMKQMEHSGEREALQLSRKLPNEDLMDERIAWKPLVPIDLKPPLAEPGKKSLEKDIQFAREKVILQALYFNRSMLPDSAAEPDPETHQMTDPVTIPLDDVTGNPDSVNDYQNTPWPEPKGSPPHVSPMPGGPPLFGGIPPFNPQMGPPGFHGMQPPFGGPNFIPPHNMIPGSGEWRQMQDGGNVPPDVNHPMNQNMFNNRPDGFGNMMDENNAGFPPQGFGPGPGGPVGPGGPGGPGGPIPNHPPGPMYGPNFGNNRGNNRGGFRNMGRGGWFRPAGPPPPGWHGANRGGGNHWGGRGGVCKQFKMQGFCRQRESCPFMHPQGNAPF